MMEPIAQPDLAAAMDKLWSRFLPETRDRVTALEIAAAAFAAGKMTGEQREAAHAAAHKLAGTLGTFGLTRGTVLARELELMYARDGGPEPAVGEKLISIAGELRALIERHK